MSAFVIGQLDVFDREAYQAYLDGFMPSFVRHGGELLATSAQETQLLEGTWAYPKTVLMRFPDADAARAWYNDPEYQALKEIRHRTARANLVLLQGVPAND